MHENSERAYKNTKKTCKSFKLDKSNAVGVGTTAIKRYLSICLVRQRTNRGESDLPLRYINFPALGCIYKERFHLRQNSMLLPTFNIRLGMLLV